MNAMLPMFASPADTTKAPNIIAAARALTPHLARSRPLDRKLVSNTMTLLFGASDAEGAWTWRDAYDANEAALVLQLRRLAPQIGRVEDAPAEIAAMLATLGGLTLTHTRRSEEQVALDQFSTPPALAAVAVAAAQIRPGDLVCEPSAGTGLLAVIAEACGATLQLNEMSDHRADMLDLLFPNAPRTRHDAAHLKDLIPSSGSFHAVITNPPFQHLQAHLVASMALLADGGRLSAIVPARAFDDADLIAALSKVGRIVGAMAFPDNAFAKHGTGVESGLLVIDREQGAPAWDRQVAAYETMADVARAAAALPPRPTAQARKFREVAIGSMLAPRVRGLATGSAKLQFLQTATRVEYETVPWTGPGKTVGLYQAYQLSRVRFERSTPHPSDLVESGPMASVALPSPTYRPVLPAPIIEQGLISDAQMEFVVYAGEAHSRMLPGWWTLGEAPQDLRLVPEGTPGAFQLRQGVFLGDGTGCGKGRQGAGVILDNMCQGRLRHVWISKNDPLLDDARRDWSALGGSITDIVPQSRWKQEEGIRLDKGILFTTYATLRQPARQGKQSRLDQIVAWLGPDFDGVIMLDEAHGLANAARGGENARGPKKASLQGQAGLILQNRLPNARVLYVSATGATTPENLAYASRLGLWGGPEAPFSTREDFMTAVESGGVAVMELIARELKAMGLYIARSLSFDGVEYEPLRHELTEENIRIWNDWADAFQIIHTNLAAALEATGATDEDGKTVSAQHKSAVMSAFEGAKQRFFGHLLAGMKAPTLIKTIRDDVLPAGHSAVIQIVSTNEAVMERRLATIPLEEHNNLAIDLTPKEYVLDYLANAFPVHAMQEVEDEAGNVTLQPLTDGDGRPVLSQEALALREELIFKLATLPAVPGVLDAVIHAFSTDQVAEITGRSRRVVKQQGRLMLERRPSSSARSETDAFMSGRKRTLIFSEAGGTGRSYHADKSAPNHQRRVHFLIEPGWRADSAIQGLGRTHRTNQAEPPLFRPVTTDIQGEKRFLSTIARRLDSLGALTRGERRTAGNGLFRAEDNLESPWARRALIGFYNNLVWGTATAMPLDEFMEKTGLNLMDADGAMKASDKLPPMNVFLNRVLALRIEDQNAIFADFERILTSILEQASASGQLDRGVEDIAAEDLAVVSEEVIRTDALTGAETKLTTFEIKTRRLILSADEALSDTRRREAAYYVNKKSGAAALVRLGCTMTDAEDRLVAAVALQRPTGRETVSEKTFNESAWTECPEPIWRAAWDAEVARTSPFVVRKLALVTGLLLPIWSKMPKAYSYVRRLRAPDGRSWLGRVIDVGDIPSLRIALGLTDVAQVASDGGEVFNIVLKRNSTVDLAGDMNLRRVRIMDRDRLEIVGGAAHHQDLKQLGAFVEIINWTTRVFVPTDKPEVLTRILAKWPATAIHSQKAAA